MLHLHPQILRPHTDTALPSDGKNVRLDTCPEGVKISCVRQLSTALAERSRGTPRTPALHPQAVACGACVANRLERRAHDLAQMREVDLTGDIASETMRLLRVGELGLEAYDLKYMNTMLTVYAQQPVGPQSMSAATGIPVVTITNHIEPWLMKAGLLRRTRQGRELTEQGQALIRTQGRLTTGFEDEPD
jgi:Holliday junction resolvasome RuvABC ATP-dependent DNA helicase subunit